MDNLKIGCSQHVAGEVIEVGEEIRMTDCSSRVVAEDFDSQDYVAKDLIKNMKAIIAGGGTGGHIYPGIAVADRIKEVERDSEILFVGTAYGLESKIVPSLGLNLKLIETSGIKGKSAKDLIKSIFKIPMGFFQSVKILFSFKPDIVIGVGGYASGPTVLCAALMFIPTVILEQNFFPGITNRILSRVVKKIGVNFESSIQFFPKNKVIVTGNPIRSNILKGSRERAIKLWNIQEGCFTLLVFGGSQGARKINQGLVQALPMLEQHSHIIQIIHQTGKADFEWVNENYRRSKIKAYVTPYINEMNEAYAVADLVLCRSGALTLSEISACGKASILVPYPYATNNHQELNAREFVDNKAALMIPDRDLSGEVLYNAIKVLMDDRKRINELEKNSRMLSKTDAAQRIVDVCKSLIEGKILNSKS